MGLKWLGSAFCILTISAAGCAYYSRPVIDHDFEGINGAAKSARIVRIVFIHGMGDHLPGYSAKVVAELSPRLDLVAVGETETRRIRYRTSQAEAAQVRIVRLRSTASKQEFRVYEVTWSPLTVPIKDRYLNFDRAPQYNLHRAPINRALKEQLLDRNVADAVLYLGDFGDALRWTIEQSLCHAVNDRHSGDGACDLKGTDIAGLERDEIVFITSSLGSRMLFDTLLRLLEDDTTRVATETTIARTNLVFMLANQIPLLELGNVKGPVPGTGTAERAAMVDRPIPRAGLPAFTNAWLDIKQARTRTRLEPMDAMKRDLQIVAFSDPNDILSYRLPENAAHSDKGIKLINVVVSNVPEILGLFARPDKAHTSYDENPRVLDLIICGSMDRKPGCETGQ